MPFFYLSIFRSLNTNYKSPKSFLCSTGICDPSALPPSKKDVCERKKLMFSLSLSLYKCVVSSLVRRTLYIGKEGE